MAENEIDALLSAQVGEPVPGEHAFGSDDKVVAVRFDQAQEEFGTGRNVAVQHDLSGGVEDTDVHGVGMQIDAAVKKVLFGVKSHGAGSFL
jgi:hypothetical protein